MIGLDQGDFGNIMSDEAIEYSRKPIALIFANSEQLSAEIHSDVKMAGGRLAKALPVDEASDQLARQVAVDIIYVVLETLDDIAISLLERIDIMAATQSVTVILRLKPELLDRVFAIMSAAQVDYLLDDSRADSVAALALAMRPREMVLNDISAESDITNLRKISADVERIAQTLAQLAIEDDDQDEMALREGPVGFQPAPGLVGTPLGRAAQSEDDAKERRPVTSREIRNMIHIRRMRGEFFQPMLFADPAWDMLLDLMAARLEDANVSVSSLCIAANVPQTTALRWIKSMTDANVFQRRADSKDGRRVFIELSDNSAAAMIGYFAAARRAETDAI